MNAEIHRITEADIPGYHACLDVVARERRYLAFLSAPPLEQTRTWVLPHIEKNHPFYVAAVEGHVVGWCDISLQEREGFTHRGVIGMGVLPDFRGRGIGHRLLRASVDHAHQLGIERIELEVFVSNQPAIHLYESFGFAVEGTLRHGRKLDGKYDDVLAMALITDFK
jgi:RimJ/RimL family protein N-acetyltransferase